jgi:hypothetical protein
MTTENISIKIPQSNSVEEKQKKINDLKDFFKYVSEGKLVEMAQLLVENEFAEKSLNIALGKAFVAYRPTNEVSKEIIATLLR